MSMKAAPLLSVGRPRPALVFLPHLSPQAVRTDRLLSPFVKWAGTYWLLAHFFRLHPKIGTFQNIGIQGGAYTSQSKFLGERRKSVQLGPNWFSLEIGCFSFDRCLTSTAGPILTTFEPKIVSYSLLVHFEARIWKERVLTQALYLKMLDCV